MNMIDWYKKVVFENYANFRGRARRSEYWYFALCNGIISMVFYIPLLVTGGFSDNSEPGIIFWLCYGLLMVYGLATFVPTLAVTVRRLHDIGKSGWYYFVGFIPLVGPIILLVWFFTEGEGHTNQWGSDPKDIFGNIHEIGKPQV
ncbi:DUF805 domain-containing protein [Moheibacter sediminis]|uniref:Uncharacterized membrane protein YhaH, DUF805 family n=1 Tax=Moheibacter sediminis TaxID=1434700 RepID=A0A1W1YGK5_9FLAO|nr:DUF805 domain-containing protein [Moheibacter sediminis]SMC35340.1 Uncharacterized membrane protein YhaH, DUF805 family [Moheibacter sediminis]